jgi:hypothetical protein
LLYVFRRLALSALYFLEVDVYVQDADASDGEQSEGEPFHRAAIGAPMAMTAKGKKRKQQQRERQGASRRLDGLHAALSCIAFKC